MLFLLRICEILHRFPEPGGVYSTLGRLSPPPGSVLFSASPSKYRVPGPRHSDRGRERLSCVLNEDHKTHHLSRRQYEWWSDL